MYRFEITLEELTTTFITNLRFGMEHWDEEIIIIEEEDDFCDDVDESDYDPYLGQDWYDCFGYPDWY